MAYSVLRYQHTVLSRCSIKVYGVNDGMPASSKNVKKQAGSGMMGPVEYAMFEMAR